MRGCWGPFEDSEGLASHFAGGANRLAGTKRIKRLRVDLLTSCAKVLREATGFKPQFLVGLGQGGLVAAVLRWPLVVELTLQASSVRRPAPPARPGRALRLSGRCGHVCACGKRTYLFSRCPSCIEQEALDTAVEIAEREDVEVRGSPDRDPESPEVGVEVNGVLAARERAGGVLEVPSSAVQSWAAGFLQAPRDEAVQTLFGSLRGKLWKGGSHLTLSRGTSTDQLKYITAWVVREGVVVLGHNSSPVDTIRSGVVLSWSVEPNWHGHAVCETLWRASGQEVALDPAFDRLLCMIGKPRRVEGWFDSEGEACIAHRRGLRKQGVLATFKCLGEGHWTTAPLTAKIVVDESN